MLSARSMVQWLRFAVRLPVLKFFIAVGAGKNELTSLSLIGPHFCPSLF